MYMNVMIGLKVILSLKLKERYSAFSQHALLAETKDLLLYSDWPLADLLGSSSLNCV